MCLWVTGGILFFLFASCNFQFAYSETLWLK